MNAYMWADARAIARIAQMSGDANTAKQFTERAADLKHRLQEKLWDEKREFFLHMYMRDEEREGNKIEADTLTYQTGRYAGDPHGRELIGYVPWQFNLPNAGYEEAWQFLMRRDGFYATFGPTTVERDDPQFLISKTCCVWSGQSWPYATTQTLAAMANLLNNYEQDYVDNDDYVKLLGIYARTHRKEGRPYIAEAAHPDNGSWEGHDNYNHSEHYFHSAFCDLVITGLVGLHPRDDDVVEVRPLAPDDWDFFALDNVAYHGHDLAIVWDRTGKRYGLGAGLHILVDGKKVATAERLEKLTVRLPEAAEPVEPQDRDGRADGATLPLNYAVNNDGRHYPRVLGSYASGKSHLAAINDGNYWYDVSPPNRWTTEGSDAAEHWCGVDFGTKRTIDTVKLYLLDDGEGVVAPASYHVQFWNGDDWADVPGQLRAPAEPTGHRSNVVGFKPLETTKIRVLLVPREGAAVGLTELETWGPGTLPLEPVPNPEGNLALREEGKEYPKASASWTSQYDKVEMANDGISNFRPGPHNRWTSYESPHESDWLQIDFGRQQTVGRLELHIYDDGGGVQAPESYNVQYWDGDDWRDTADQKRSPESPAGGLVNTVKFKPFESEKFRVVFTHKGKSRSGLTEIEAWPK
jgi:hypothetical protein